MRIKAAATAAWSSRKRATPGATIAATRSLAFWIAVVFFGRQIGFAMMPV
jgi:hypothetical protein